MDLVEVSPQAHQAFTQLAADGTLKDRAIRLSFDGLGCGGPQIGLSLDALNPDETVYDHDEIRIVIDDVMREQIVSRGGMLIDFIHHPRLGSGFAVRFGEQDGGCGCDSNPTGTCGGGCSGCG